MKKKIFLFNKKVYYNFNIIKTINAGLILKGWEIKSIRKNNINILNSYISIIKNNVYLINSNIKFLNNSTKNEICKENRKIKLLLKKKEILYLISKIYSKRITIVPICLFWKNFLCKIKIGLAKGKKMSDKRSSKKEKEWNIEKMRFIKKSLR
ncbi:SsrA-binding protein SmpB [Buchnera aphidicola (Ceratovacuna keduensis)]|uniref:SsrA-binding protein SmpB n=1 Tax=Buchnera aphidicola TaxID=9 RepID=UPI0031B89BDB